MKIALLLLLGVVSAADLKRQQRRKTFQKVALDDQGFIVLGQQMFIKKESDWLANGDDKDDLEVQNEFDKEDPVVMDNGFGLSGGNWKGEHEWTANQYKGSLRDFVQLNSEHKSHAKAKKESDWISNADGDDDKECESELGDGSDEIVTDNGFALAGGNWGDNKWKQNHYDPDLMFLMSQYKEHKAHKHHKKHHKPGNHSNIQLGRESDWISNADAADDKEVESELGDEEDEIVSDTGFALAAGNWEANQYKNDQYKHELNFVQLEDHFYTENFKDDHPSKLKNAFYQRGEDSDVMNLQMSMEYNEIDNYNPRAQARLAKYEKFM